LKTYAIEIKAYGHVSVFTVKATSRREAIELAMDKKGITITAKEAGRA